MRSLILLFKTYDQITDDLNESIDFSRRQNMEQQQQQQHQEYDESDGGGDDNGYYTNNPDYQVTFILLPLHKSFLLYLMYIYGLNISSAFLAA